jgi:hypothetical protein
LLARALVLQVAMVFRVACDHFPLALSLSLAACVLSHTVASARTMVQPSDPSTMFVPSTDLRSPFTGSGIIAFAVRHL